MTATTGLARNLTAAEARERAGLLDVASYDVHLVLDEGEHFESRTTVRFRSGAGRTFLELDGELLEGDVDGTPLALQGNRLPLELEAGEHVATVVARCRTTSDGVGLVRSVDPADGAVYVYGQSFLDDAQRIFACFDQPDLKATFTLTVDAPESWVVRGNTTATSSAGGRHVFEPTERMPPYLFSLAGGPWHGETAHHEGLDLGVWCRASLAPYFEADEILAVTRQCLDFQQPLFGRPMPFGRTYDQVFVPGLQRGRDGERRPGHVRRRALRQPQPDDPRRAPAARPGRRARARPHVVRQPGDDALVGRPVAQRVVRRADGAAHGRGGHRVRRRVGRLRDGAQGLGLSRRLAPDDAPDRRGGARQPRRADELRRHLLRQGRGGPAPALGLDRRGRLLRRRTPLPRPPRLGQHLPRRPARRSGGGVRPRPPRLVLLMVADGRDVDAPRSRRSAGERRRPAAPRGRRALLRTAAAPGREARRRGAGLTAADRTWPTWCCPTTATSPSPRSGSTSAPWTPCDLAAHPGRPGRPRRWSGGRCGTPPATPSSRPHDYVRVVLANVRGSTDPDLVGSLLAQARIAARAVGRLRRAGGPPARARDLGRDRARQ